MTMTNYSYFDTKKGGSTEPPFFVYLSQLVRRFYFFLFPECYSHSMVAGGFELMS